MVLGTVKAAWTRGFTFIQPDGAPQKLFFHTSCRADGQQEADFLPGCRVSYEVIVGQKGPQATAVTCVEHKAPEPVAPPIAVGVEGSITKWLGHRGFGFVDTAAHKGVFVHKSQIRSGRAEAGAVITGNIVPATGRTGFAMSDVAVVGWAPSGDVWHDWAYLPQGWEVDLARLAESENWNYRFTESDTPSPILRRYLRQTFLRLRDTGKIVEGEVAGCRRAALNTGLVDRLQNEIVALFEADGASEARYKLKRFSLAGDRELLQAFGAQQPELARYFDNPADVIYDISLPLFLAVDHVDERQARAPLELQGNEYGFLSAINAQKDAVLKRVARNYKTAIPQFYRPFGRGTGALQLLLPLCLVRSDRVDLALAVEKINGTYRGNTVLTLDMAYTHARLITRPDTEWLRPDGDVAGPSISGLPEIEEDVAEL